MREPITNEKVEALVSQAIASTRNSRQHIQAASMALIQRADETGDKRQLVKAVNDFVLKLDGINRKSLVAYFVACGAMKVSGKELVNIAGVKVNLRWATTHEWWKVKNDKDSAFEEFDIVKEVLKLAKRMAKANNVKANDDTLATFSKLCEQVEILAEQREQAA